MTFRQRLTVLPRDVLWLLYTNSSLMWPFSVKRYSIILQIIYVVCSTFKTIKSKWVRNFEFFWNVRTVSEIFQLSVLYDVFSITTYLSLNPATHPQPKPGVVSSYCYHTFSFLWHLPLEMCNIQWFCFVRMRLQGEQ